MEEPSTRVGAVMDIFFAELLMEDLMFMGLDGPGHVVEQRMDPAAFPVGVGQPTLGLAARR